MKFAKVLEQTLKEQSIPDEWVKSAIQYKALKKCISQVVRELQSLGLEKELLQKLLIESSKIYSVDEEADHGAIEYSLSKKNDAVVPKLSIRLDNTEITEEVRQKLIHFIENDMDQISTPTQDLVNDLGIDSIEKPLAKIEVSSNKYQNVSEITISLQSDSKFFMMLNDELNALDALKTSQESQMTKAIDIISTMVGTMSNPSARRSDLYIWREIFKIYLDSEVYFRYNDSSANERSVIESRENLNEFIERIQKTELLKKFRHKKSLIAFNQFVALNLDLLRVLQFQTINKTAITKILKKFDKRTSLNAKSTFPKLISRGLFINESFAKTICAIMANNILGIVPQLDDYSCPICVSVAYKPIRLECDHIFCVRCLVKLQKQSTDSCPLCRHASIMKANQLNLDVERMRYIELYFPKETKEKLKERAQEQLEAVYGKPRCVVQ